MKDTKPKKGGENPIGAARNPVAGSPLWFLYVTAFVCGAMIMVIEILGARILGPLFGVGLFVWTAQIAVAMVALAAGYALGGLVTDRTASADVLFGLIAASGAVLLGIAPIKSVVLKWGLGFGLRGGALVSSAALFGLPLLLLGCVSPGVIRLTSRRVERVGRTAGGVYALSTLGSVLGTVLTGFVLIGLWEVPRILAGGGAVLLAVAAGHFLLTRRWRRGGALGVLALLVVTGPSFGPEVGLSRQLPSGTVATLVHARSGLYGDVRVIDYRYRDLVVRELTIDGLIQGGVDRTTGLPTYEYLYLLAFVPPAVRPGGNACLVLGLGAGIVPRLLEARGISTDVVEIDPNVLDAARRFFSFRTQGAVYVEDARVHLSRAVRRYDYVLVDVFNGDGVPTHLVSVEAFRAAKARLSDNGVLALNFHGRLDLARGGTAAVVRTLLEVFDNVDLYPAFRPSGSAPGNLVIVAYDGPPSPVGPAVLEGVAVHAIARRGLEGFWARRVPARSETVSGPVLSDDYNPVDLMDLDLREGVRRGFLADTPWDLLVD